MPPAADDVWQISARSLVYDPAGVYVGTMRAEYLADRAGGRYRMAQYILDGRLDREVSVLGRRHVLYLPQSRSATVRTAANLQEPFLSEVDNELWLVQKAAQSGRATVVGPLAGSAGQEIEVRLQTPRGLVSAAYDARTGLATRTPLGAGARREIVYDRIVRRLAASVADPEFEVAVPPTAFLQTYGDLLAADAPAPPQGVYWVGSQFGGLELKAIQRIGTEPRQPTDPPGTDRVTAIYGLPGVVGSAVAQVITEPLPSAAAQQAGRTVQPGVVRGSAPARLELLGGALVTLVGRDAAEVQALAGALQRRP